MPIPIQNNMPVLVNDIPRPHPADAVFARAGDKYKTHPQDQKLRKIVDRHYLQISPHHYMERSMAKPDKLVAYGGRSHPRSISYQAPARTRILAHLMENPRWIADAWSAAALFGLTYFVDSADTFIVSGGDSRLAKSHLYPTRRRTRIQTSTWTLHAYGHKIFTLEPAEALVQCIVSVYNHTHWWHCPEVPRLSPETTRAVQVIDHFRRALGIDTKQIAQQAKRTLNRATIRRLIKLSDDGADSPQETVLRLVAAKIATDHRLILESQTELREGDKILTVFDLAIRAIKLGLMYDGGHHRDPTQYNKDMWITAVAELHGWTVLRINAEMLEDPVRLVELIKGAILRATTALNAA